MAQTNITPEHKRLWKALRDPEYGSFALFSCFLNGQPAVAIVNVLRDGEQYTVTPLFVSVDDEMVLTDHEGAPCKG